MSTNISAAIAATFAPSFNEFSSSCASKDSNFVHEPEQFTPRWAMQSRHNIRSSSSSTCIDCSNANESNAATTRLFV
jgi:hypothetical protein